MNDQTDGSLNAAHRALENEDDENGDASENKGAFSRFFLPLTHGKTTI